METLTSLLTVLGQRLKKFGPARQCRDLEQELCYILRDLHKIPTNWDAKTTTVESKLLTTGNEMDRLKLHRVRILD